MVERLGLDDLWVFKFYNLEFRTFLILESRAFMTWQSFNFDILEDLNFDDLGIHLVTWESVILLT